ncbi:MAG: helix-turn-helix domain-containing protein [Bacteroidota bacterium]|nr:helix-turn-helix domain-containing protein [Bacteroidota bacterium]
MSAKIKTQKNSSVPKGLKESEIWSVPKMNKIGEFILAESKKQTPERKLRNEFLSIKYLMEDYIVKEKVEREMRILDFVRLYLKLLKISQKELASGFEMKDTNLYKYLTGERKLNPDIVLKLSSFSHTQPELWYRIQIKNELDELRKEKEKFKEYKKYGYKKFISSHA